MKKTILFATIALTLLTIIGCKKDEESSSSSNISGIFYDAPKDSVYKTALYIVTGTFKIRDFSLTSSQPYNSSSDISITKSGNNLTIPSQKFTPALDSTQFDISGTGTLNGNELTMFFKIDNVSSTKKYYKW